MKTDLINRYNEYCRAYPDAVKYTGKQKSSDSPDECVSIRCAIAQEASKVLAYSLQSLQDFSPSRRLSIRSIVGMAISYDVGTEIVSWPSWIQEAFINQFNY